ncbi:Hypothetical predicted protein [Cloeon dipterum]|uniref:Peptidase M13 N-terminal domain-containing protein n=1 Tax=Cloeon dipterum TaxID=197152 RepID=A0A8S1DAI0_9INSE|nr:Hypothetical predicted protein [Cloeon dipterum]
MIFFNSDSRPQRKIQKYIERAYLLFSVITLFLAMNSFISPAFRKYDDSEKCITNGCFTTSSKLLSQINESVDPCDDFYAYACGGWIEKYSISDGASHVDQFQLIDDGNLFKIREILEANDEYSKILPVTKARQLYSVCMEEDELERKSLEPIFKVLRSLGLPEVPSQDKENRFSWQEVVAQAERMLGDSIFFFLEVAWHPSQPHKHALQVRQGNFNDLPEVKRLDLIEDFIADYIELLLLGKEVDAKRMASDLYTFHRKLRSLIQSPDVVEDQQMTLADLQNLTDHNIPINNASRFVWSDYLDNVFDGYDFHLKRPNDLLVFVQNQLFFEQWSQLLHNTDPATIELYVWWRVFSSLAPHATSEFRERWQKLWQKVSGIRDTTPRWKVCAQKVDKAYGMAVGFVYVKKYFNEGRKNTIVKSLFEAFKNTLFQLNWMEDVTKKLALKKIYAIKFVIGYPDWLLVPGELEKYYAEFDVFSAGMFQSHLKTLSALEDKKLRPMTMPMNDNIDFNPHTTDVFYDRGTNSIVVPAGILGAPFNDFALNALRYGSVGALIGNAFTHALDDIGRQYTQLRSLRHWWSLKTLAEYNDCRMFIFDQNSRGNVSVNRIKSQDDSMTDNVGLREALHAYDQLKFNLTNPAFGIAWEQYCSRESDYGVFYSAAYGVIETSRNYLVRKFNHYKCSLLFVFSQTVIARPDPEPELPGFDDILNNQLFFLGYASMHCSNEFHSGKEQWSSEGHRSSRARALR